jgi:membrane peptidoglycan carboxypeptidase
MAGYFCDYAVKQFRDDDAFGGTKDQRTQLLYRGGLSITTTLDRGKQQAAVDAVNNGVPYGSTVPTTDAKGKRLGGTTELAAALSSVEPGTGKIIAMAQDRSYNTSPDAPAGSTSVNYNTDASMGGSTGFQVGSSYKPFTLATWLANGHTVNQSITAPGSPHTYSTRDFHASCGNINTSVPYIARNSEGDEAGTMSVAQATYDSVNTAYLEMARQLDLCQIRDTAAALGVHRANGKPLSYSPSSVLGPNEIAPLTMAAAYATFAAQGTYCAPTAIAAITDADGKAIAVPGPQCKQAISPDVANGVTYALQQVLTNGTGKGDGLADGRPAAGKTGTTNLSVAAWFSGYTPQLATSVWLGSPTVSMSTNGATIKGQHYGKMFGATVSGPIWRDYMNTALAGQPAPGFTAPPGNILGAAPQRPNDSGGSTGDSSPTSRPTKRSTPSATQTQQPAPPTDQPAPTDQGQGGGGGNGDGNNGGGNGNGNGNGNGKG